MSETKYCHYTSIENASNILSSDCFFLSKFNSMNDLTEADLHNDEKDRVFSLSFCHSEAVNIPLYYLYGGIDGKDCRIQFSQAKLNELKNNCEIYYVNKKQHLLKQVVNPSNYDIIYDWIYYVSSDGSCNYHNQECSKYKNFNDALNDLKKNDLHYFLKSRIWKFEKEYRIIVKFHTDIIYPRIALKFNLKNKESGLSVMCGPEISQQELSDFKEEMHDYGIANVDKISDKKISMKLVERNKRLYQKQINDEKTAPDEFKTSGAVFISGDKTYHMFLSATVKMLSRSVATF